jgi:hypothetical protein
MFATTLNAMWIIVALFQDSTANALAVSTLYMQTATAGGTVPLSYRMVAGTTSSTTFKIRIGTQGASTVTLNGQSSARLFGGVAISILKIKEVTP